jgi:hypothetical protein
MTSFWDFMTGNSGRTVLALAAIVISATIAITIFILNRKKKSLSYEFISMTRVVSVKEDMAARIQVLVDGAPVQDVGVVQVRIANTGTEPIRAADYVRAISFSVGGQARIIEATVSEIEPANIDAAIVKEEQRVVLQPTLLNSKDSLVLKLLVANFDGHVAVDSRIEGVELRPSPRLADSKWVPIFIAALKFASISAGLAGAAELGVSRTATPNDYKN